MSGRHPDAPLADGDLISLRHGPTGEYVCVDGPQPGACYLTVHISYRAVAGAPVLVNTPFALFSGSERVTVDGASKNLRFNGPFCTGEAPCAYGLGAACFAHADCAEGICLSGHCTALGVSARQTQIRSDGRYQQVLELTNQTEYSGDFLLDVQSRWKVNGSWQTTTTQRIKKPLGSFEISTITVLSSSACTVDSDCYGRIDVVNAFNGQRISRSWVPYLTGFHDDRDLTGLTCFRDPTSSTKSALIDYRGLLFMCR